MDLWLLTLALVCGVLIAAVICGVGWWVWNFTGSIDEQALRGLWR